MKTREALLILTISLMMACDSSSVGPSNPSTQGYDSSNKPPKERADNVEYRRLPPDIIKKIAREFGLKNVPVVVALDGNSGKLFISTVKPPTEVKFPIKIKDGEIEYVQKLVLVGYTASPGCVVIINGYPVHTC